MNWIHMFFLRLLLNDENNTAKKVAIAVIVVNILVPIFIVILIAAALSMPVQWIKEFLMLEGTPVEEIEIIQQIRPDLIEKDQTLVDGYDYGMPINRTVQHYFGDEVNGKCLDYLTYNCNGDNLYAIADGTVVEMDSSEALGGWYIIVEHDAPEDDEANWSLYSKYWAIDTEQEHVEVGDDVEQGEIIAHGLTSADEHSTMIFCFQMYGDSDFEPIDPLPYIGEKSFDEEVIDKMDGSEVVVTKIKYPSNNPHLDKAKPR